MPFGREYIHMLRPRTCLYLHTDDLQPASSQPSWSVDGTTDSRSMGVVFRPPQMSRIRKIEKELPCMLCADPQKVQLVPGPNGGMSAVGPSDKGVAPAEPSFSSASVGCIISYAQV